MKKCLYINWILNVMFVMLRMQQLDFENWRIKGNVYDI